MVRGWRSIKGKWHNVIALFFLFLKCRCLRQDTVSWTVQPLGPTLASLTLPCKACQNCLGAWPLPPCLLGCCQWGFSRELCLLLSWTRPSQSQGGSWECPRGSLGHKLGPLSLSPVDKSQNHRMFEAGRDLVEVGKELWRSPGPTPLMKQSLVFR